MKKAIPNILIIQKQSKLAYLFEKYGIKETKSSEEYNMLSKSMETHKNNSDNFIKQIHKNFNRNYNIDTITDNFLENERIKTAFDKNNYDLVFSLGGDGTFLRAAQFMGHRDQTLVGVNTDFKYSKGYYCNIQAENENENTKIFDKIKSNKADYKYLPKIRVSVGEDKRKYYFLNDLFFGENFMGRVSKFKLNIDNNDMEEQVVKSSGVLFSTCKIFYLIIDAGYSGWIQNSNTISYNKFHNLIEHLNQKTIEKDKALEIYKNISRSHSSNTDDQDIFYFVREPGIPYGKSTQAVKSFLERMDGTTKQAKITNYCYQASLILDGSFDIPIKYNDILEIESANSKLRTI